MPKTPEQILYHTLYKRFQKALTDFSMLSDGDRILIGLSGGKDSLCLLEMLAQRQRIYKPRIEVEAVHVRMANVSYESDTSYLESFAKEHGVKLHIVQTAFDDTTPSDKPVCFLCSWHRRKALFRFAQDNGFNKIALGHHQDDIIHTTMLNTFYEGSFSTMPAVKKLDKMPLTIIRLSAGHAIQNSVLRDCFSLFLQIYVSSVCGWSHVREGTFFPASHSDVAWHILRCPFRAPDTTDG